MSSYLVLIVVFISVIYIAVSYKRMRQLSEGTADMREIALLYVTERVLFSKLSIVSSALL